MAQETPSEPNFTVLGYSEEMFQSLMRRRAETSAAHLLPHLKPGLRVLDVGCGPGNISVGLAQAVAPGEFYAIDKEQPPVDLARALAAALQCENATFQVGDAISLPFGDGFFDVVHYHDALMHIPDTQTALAEAMRVLKPGGIISCRDIITQSSFTYPDYGVMEKSWEVLEDVVATDGGHPQMGKELKMRLAQAGFTDTRITASAEIFSTPEEIEFIFGLVSQWFLSRDVTDMALHYGATTLELANATAEAYQRWKEDPGALCILAYGEAVAFKP